MAARDAQRAAEALKAQRSSEREAKIAQKQAENDAKVIGS